MMMESSILNALKITLPMMKRILNLDMQICLCDREKTLGVWYGDTFHMDIKIGEMFDIKKPGHDMMMKVIETGQGSRGILPEFVYGVPVDGILTPVFEDGQVVGVVSCAISVKDRVMLEQSAASLNDNLGHTNQNVAKIAEASKELSDKAEEIHRSAESIEQMATNTFDTVKVIKDGARKSHMLALNAAIEAARAGQNGRGFSIVANEMSTLAKASGDSAAEIGERVSVILKELQDIAASLANIAQISSEQTNSVANINENLDKIKGEAAQLAKAAKIS